MENEETLLDHRELLDENEQLRKEIEALKAKNNDLHAELHGETRINNSVIVDTDTLNEIMGRINAVLDLLSEADLDAHILTDAQRNRLLGAGVRRYGFIEKVTEVSYENSQFFPGFFSYTELNNANIQVGLLRNIMIGAQRILRIVADNYLLTSDDAFRFSRLYYVSVRDAARNGVPGARPLFDALRLLFRRSSIKTDEPPTVPEVERDVRALLHGHKDGRIVIEHERPHKVGGKHVVVDETASAGSTGSPTGSATRPHGTFKETETEQL